MTLPLIHALTISEPYYWHVDPRLIDYETFASQDSRWYVLLSVDKVVGAGSFSHLDPINRSASLGLVVLPELRAGGYGAAAHDELVAFAFDSLRLHRLWASVLEPNKLVWQGLEKRGWKLCGFLSECQWIEGRWQGRRLYEKLAKEVK